VTARGVSGGDVEEVMSGLCRKQSKSMLATSSQCSVDTIADPVDTGQGFTWHEVTRRWRRFTGSISQYDHTHRGVKVK